MWSDPIVKEIREGREAYSTRFANDVRRICADLEKRQQQHADRLVRLAPRKLEANERQERREELPA